MVSWTHSTNNMNAQEFFTLNEILNDPNSFQRLPGYSNMSPVDVDRFVAGNPGMQVPVAGGALDPELARQQAQMEFEGKQMAANTAPRRSDVADILGVQNLTGMTSYGGGQEAINAYNRAEQMLSGNTPAQNAQIQKQLGTLSMLTPLTGKNVNPALVKGVLENLGITPSPFQAAYQEAAGKEAGKRSVTGGGLAAGIPTDLRDAMGTSKFPDLMIKYAGKFDFDDQMKLEKLHDARFKALSPSEKVATQYENAASSVGRLERLKEKYNVAVPENAPMSKNLKLAIAQASTPAAIIQGQVIPYVDKLTDAEVQFVAEANSILSGMRQMYDDTRMSDQDVRNFLRALGSPVTGKKLFNAQLDATTKVIEDRRDAIARALQGAGKDVSRLKGYQAPKGQQKATEGTLPNGKRWRTVDGKIQIEE
jgi:hypothetical protein